MTQQINTKQSVFKKLGQSIKQLFLRLWMFIKTQLHPLVMMQLKDKIDFSFLKNKKKTAFKLIWIIVGMVAVTAIIYIAFSLTIKFMIFDMSGVYLNFKVFVLLITILLILSFISCLTNMTNTLYFSRDNPVLLTMPVKNSTIFMSKMVVCYVYELIKNSSFMIPVLLAYGIVMHLPFLYYLWLIFIIAFVTLFMVVLSGLLSIPAMFVASVLKKHRVLEFIVLALIAAGISYGVVKLILAIPTDIDLVRDWGQIYTNIGQFLKTFIIIFAPFAYLVQFMTGTSVFQHTFSLSGLQYFEIFAVILCAIILCLILISILAKPLFLKMASTPFEYKRKINTKNKTNFQKPFFLSVVWSETKQIFRTSNVFYGIFALVIVTPILILLQNQIFSSMDIRTTGKNMALVFNVLIIMLFVLSSSSNFASLFSREGNSGYLTKTLPISPAKVLLAKPVFQVLMFTLSIAVSTFIIKLYADISLSQSILLFFAILFVYLAHVFWSLEFDIMNPQNRLYQTTGKQLKNPNESKSIILGFIIAAIFGFITYFLISENKDTVFLKIFLIALLFASIRVFFLMKRIKLYYKEK